MTFCEVSQFLVGNKFLKQTGQVLEPKDEVIIPKSFGRKDMGKVDQLEFDRVLEFLRVASLDWCKIVDEKKTTGVEVVAPLTLKELHKLVQLLQENVGNKNREMRLKSDEMVQHFMDVADTKVPAESLIDPLHPFLIVADDPQHAEAERHLKS